MIAANRRHAQHKKPPDVATNLEATHFATVQCQLVRITTWRTAFLHCAISPRAVLFQIITQTFLLTLQRESNGERK